MSLHADLAQLLADRRYRDVTKGDAGILRTALAKEDEATLHEFLPSIIRTALLAEAKRAREAEAYDRIELARAKKLAARHNQKELRARLEAHRQETQRLGEQAAKGVARMDRGRPTGGAVAQEAHGHRRRDERILELALEMLERMP